MGKARDSHVIAKKNTDNYVVELVDEDDYYVLRVRYRPAEMKEWLRSEVRGDLDVAELLGQAGYDQYTNPVGRRQRPARITL